MALKMKERNDGNLVDIGDDVRIERRALSHGVDPKTGAELHKWVVYERVPTGLEVKEESKQLLKSGAHYQENAPSFEVHTEHIAKMGKHPVIKNDKGEAADTLMEFVWVPYGEPVDSKDEAMKVARELTGEK